MVASLLKWSLSEASRFTVACGPACSVPIVSQVSADTLSGYPYISAAAFSEVLLSAFSSCRGHALIVHLQLTAVDLTSCVGVDLIPTGHRLKLPI